MRGGAALAIAALLLMPVLAVHDAHAAAFSPIVSQAIKNANGKAIEQINAG